MATQSEMALISPPAVARAQDVSKSQAADPNTTQETQETDLAWELVKDECHDVLEQLPLTLQRNYALMRDLDEQVAAHLQAIPTVLHEYIELRKQLTQDVIMADAQTNGELDGHGGVEHQSKRAASRASFSSASLTPITDSPSTRSLSIPNPRRGRNNSSPDGLDEEETEEPETSFESQAAPAVKPTSTELIARIATLATDAVRGSLEKVNLSNAAFASIDRHVRALDIAIAEQERAIAVGIRPGTRPAAIAIPETTSPTHTHSQSYESNNLFALAEVASAVHAAEKTLESLQPPPSAISTTISMWNDNEQEKPEEKPEEKPVVNEIKKRAETVKNTEPKPKQQQPKREKKSSKKKAGAAAAPPPVYEPEKEPTPDPDEPRYCYCDRVSFGNMIACDGPNCKREWFHWECVGITRAPSTNKWFCRDCEVREPAKKKRKR